MMIANHHTHSEFCDGKAPARDMATAARKAGFDVLGFSSHAPLPFGTAWTMDPARLGDYVSTVRALAAEHGRPLDGSPPMAILAGLEIDFIGGLCGPADGRFSGAGLDFTIGSVHYVCPAGAPAPAASALDRDGVPTFGFTVDEPEDDFAAHLASFYAGDAEALVDDYYAALAACVGSGGFDILGHFDLVRKNNPGQLLFREDSERYRAAAMQAVDALAGSGIIVEINTGGMARGKTGSPYPALWIAKELRTRGVAVCVNADAHRPAHLTANRADGIRLAVEAGYRNLTVLSGEGRREVPID